MKILHNITFILILFLITNVSNATKKPTHKTAGNDTLPQPDLDYLDFPLNLEYVEAEFYLWSVFGYGLDIIAPEISDGGPPPFGAQKALLDPFTYGIMYQFSLQELGHLRAIKQMVKGYPRPPIDISIKNFANLMNLAIGHPLFPPFNPYSDSTKFLLSVYLLPYICLNGAIGASSKVKTPKARELVAGLLAVEAGQDGVIRTLLYERRFERVYPYGITVQEFTNKISNLRNKLGHEGIKDEGLFVKPSEGAEGKTPLNILAGDPNSIGYSRNSEELLRILYTTGNESVPGGFLPKGGVGRIARSYLDKQN